MSIICLHCKTRGHGRPAKGTSGGESRVLATRKCIARTMMRGSREVTRSVRRVRQCKDCRYTWSTIEVTIVNRRKSNG